MGFLLLSRCLGMLLVGAAALKLFGLAGGELTSTAFFSTEIQVAVLELELLLGLWLLSGSNPICAWLTSLVMFASFAVMSSYQGWVGQVSCGCFGSLSVSPWYALGIDVVALGALAMCRPDLKPLREQPRYLWSKVVLPVGSVVAGAALLLAALAGVAQVAFGSTDAAWAFLRGERLSVRPRVVDIGTGVLGEFRNGTVELVNRTDSAIRVVGGTSTCSCIVTEDLPLTIPGGAASTVRVFVRFVGSEGRFRQVATLHTDNCDGPTTVRFSLVGRTRVVDTSQSQFSMK